MQHPFIVGKKIYLRGLERADMKDLLVWSNDSEVTYYMYMGAFPANIEVLEKEYEQLANSRNDAPMAMIEKETDTHVGNAGLYSINWITRSAEFRIIIGVKEVWNKGYGTEAAELCLDYGFNKLNLNRIYLGTNADHASAVKCYEKAGFLREGLFRQDTFRNGVYSDIVYMGIIRSEYETRVGKK